MKTAFYWKNPACCAVCCHLQYIADDAVHICMLTRQIVDPRSPACVNYQPIQ